MQKPKQRNRILHTLNTYGKRSGRTSHTNVKKPGTNKYRQRSKPYRKYKASTPRYAIHRTYGTQEDTIRTTSRKKKPRTELTNIVKDGKTFLSDWSELSISAPITNKTEDPHLRGSKRRWRNNKPYLYGTEQNRRKKLSRGAEVTEKKNSISDSFKFREKNHNKKSLEGKFQKKTQTAISGTENTVKTDTGKIISRKFISGPLFQTERKTRREPIPRTSGEIQPKNRHCLRGLDGKYGRWGEILRDILNGKLKIVQNRKKIGQRDGRRRR